MDPHMGPVVGTNNWAQKMISQLGPNCGITSWYHNIDPAYGSIRWNQILEPHSGSRMCTNQLEPLVGPIQCNTHLWYNIVDPTIGGTQIGGTQ